MRWTILHSIWNKDKALGAVKCGDRGTVSKMRKKCCDGNDANIPESYYENGFVVGCCHERRRRGAKS